ncbi:MAG: tRNA-dihydrouridine synthase family protein [Nitrospinota bacterium]|nr:tRNA-dihydrouridine synthase family protein [Nitrospinota bacterium]
MLIKNDIKLILAPMAGFSDQPFRRLCIRNGADEVVTELLSSNALVRDNGKTLKMAEIHPEERPASIQIFGSDPEIMAEAARRVEELRPLFIDINMGCPARKVRKGGSGSALLENPARAGEIVKRVVEAVKTPVSVKIRTGKNQKDKRGFEVALEAVQNGASRITVHARSVEDMFSGPIDFSFVSELKKRVDVEIIGNGDIKSLKDAHNWLEMTGADGLMIGRGALGMPSIFKEIRAGREIRPQEELGTILQHCIWMEEFYGSYGIGQMKGHLMHYLRGMSSAKKVRGLINNSKTFDEIKDIVKEFLGNKLENAA